MASKPAFYYEILKPVERKEAGTGTPSLLCVPPATVPPRREHWTEEDLRPLAKSRSLAKAPAPRLSLVTLGASFRFVSLSCHFWGED